MKAKIILAYLAAAAALAMGGCSADQTHEDTTATDPPAETAHTSPGAMDGADSLGDEAGEAAGDLSEGAGGAVKDAADGVGNAVKDIGEGAGEAVDDAGNAVKKAME